MSLSKPGDFSPPTPEFMEAIKTLANYIYRLNQLFFEHSLGPENINMTRINASNQLMDEALICLQHGTISLRRCTLKIASWGVRVDEEMKNARSRNVGGNLA